jgi:hypothetical protein
VGKKNEKVKNKRSTTEKKEKEKRINKEAV